MTHHDTAVAADGIELDEPNPQSPAASHVYHDATVCLLDPLERVQTARVERTADRVAYDGETVGADAVYCIQTHTTDPPAGDYRPARVVWDLPADDAADTFAEPFAHAARLDSGWVRIVTTFADVAASTPVVVTDYPAHTYQRVTFADAP